MWALEAPEVDEMQETEGFRDPEGFPLHLDDPGGMFRSPLLKDRKHFDQEQEENQDPCRLPRRSASSMVGKPGQPTPRFSIQSCLVEVAGVEPASEETADRRLQA